MTTAADQDLVNHLEYLGDYLLTHLQHLGDFGWRLCHQAASEIRHLEACVAHLRHERDQWRSIATDANRAALHHSQRHLEERQHANELAEVLRITVRDWCPGQVFVPILDHHQARREQ